eukprot:TRINITY_DN42881_c0_g1_i1.p1 TRINITY_DN42881_c0_g1~~TRINITY_DN42881_c0_g1_i1.p1  ORF type:complete len:319 (-),score=42.69 TRINITY_DN42881_c0_g1_i1:33-989(-)
MCSYWRIAGLVVLAAVWVPLTRFFFRVQYPVHRTGCVLVTGASTGIGRSAALVLLQQGYKVYAGVRKRTDVDLLEKAAGEHVRQLHPMLLDVTQEDQIQDAVNELKLCSLPFVGVVNNAGVSAKHPMETSALSDIRFTFDVNLFGVVSLTQKLIPLLRESQGRIVNIGSVSGIVTIPFSGVYSASKYALEAVSDALRLELAPWNISVSMVNPGYVTTELRAKSKAQIAAPTPLENELYGPTFERLAKKEEKLLQFGSECCACTDDAIVHALQDPYPLTRYYPAVVAPHVPAWLIVPIVKLFSIHPCLERLADLVKGLF